MEIKQSLIASNRYYLKCPYGMQATYITVHETDNYAPAANEISYMKSNDNQISFHIAVDDEEAIQAIPFNRNAWAAGDGANGTGNRQSIHVEICYNKSGGSRYEQAKTNAMSVVAQLMKQFNIKIEN
ncbi:MAG: N-acetylmuramoyl-L-alanine amidase family protein, partial [Bacillaceae bacterium]